MATTASLLIPIMQHLVRFEGEQEESIPHDDLSSTTTVFINTDSETTIHKNHALQFQITHEYLN